MTDEAQRKLRRLLNLIPNNFYEMTSGSRDIINCWINLGYDYPSPYVEEFVNIDSQADDLRIQATDEEREEFFRAFRDAYIQELGNLKRFISV